MFFKSSPEELAKKQQLKEAKKKYKENRKAELKNIIDGYPMTKTPAIPEILKHAVQYKQFENERGEVKLSFTLAEDVADLVQPKSLEDIRTTLLAHFRNSPKLYAELNQTLPTNLIAVSFSRPNFEVNNSCQEFQLGAEFTPSEDSFFTYKKLSECWQCTYYNENGVEFQAGLCFYPAPYGKPKLIFSNDAVRNLAAYSCYRYPPADRRSSSVYSIYRKYGRFCNIAGKKVVVDCKRLTAHHYEYNHKSYCYEKTSCDECEKDRKTYRWVEPKKADRKDSRATNLPCAVCQSDAQIESFGVQSCGSCAGFFRRTLEMNLWYQCRYNRTCDVLLKKRSLCNSCHYEKCIRAGMQRDDSIARIPSKPPKKSSEPLRIIHILKSAGIGALCLGKLNNFYEDTKISMVHKATGRHLPGSKWPEVKNLVLFILLNPDWNVDLEHFMKIKSQRTPVAFVPITTRLSTWLLANPDYEIQSKSALITQLMLENSSISNQISGLKRDCHSPYGSVCLSATSSGSLLEDAGNDDTSGDGRVDFDSEVDAELIN